MKNFFVLVCILLVLGCNEEIITAQQQAQQPNNLTIKFDEIPIDKQDALYTILGGYNELGFLPVDYFTSQVQCTKPQTGMSKAYVSRKDTKTLQIQFAYIGICNDQKIATAANDIEFVATFTAQAPSLPLTPQTRIELTGVCTRLKPADPKLLNQQVVGYAYLSSKLGEFFINLPDSKGVAQQIKAKMDIRSY